MHRLFQMFVILLATGSVAAAHEAAPLTGDEVRSIVSEMVADAGTRSSLQSSGGSAGHDGKFFIVDESGDFRLTVSGLLQFRYTYNERKDASDDTEGFNVTRARLWLAGRVHKNISFYVRGQFSGTTKIPGFSERSINGQLELDRAWVGFKLSEHVSLRIGQQVSPFTRENEHSPHDQLVISASPNDSVFGQGGFTGAQFLAQGEDARAWFIVSNGARAVRTTFDDPRNADYALTFKADYKFTGEWKQYSQFSSPRGSEFGAMLGAGVHYEEGAAIGNPLEDVDLFQAVVELSFVGDGWNVYTNVQYAHNDVRSNDFEDDWGFLVHGGVFVSSRVELYGRFDVIFPDEDRAAENDDFRTITSGFNFYPVEGSYAIKFSADVTYFLDPEATSIVGPSNNLSLLASNRGDQFAIRVQASMVF